MTPPPLSPAQQKVLARSLPEVRQLLGLLKAGGLAPRDITLVIVVDLRGGTGQLLAEEAFGKVPVKMRVAEALVQNAIPTMTIPLSDEGGIVALRILASEFVGAAMAREPGKIPVLVVDDQDEPGMVLLDAETLVFGTGAHS